MSGSAGRSGSTLVELILASHPSPRRSPMLPLLQALGMSGPHGGTDLGTPPA
ncbi:MAG TPA: hypothetical protein VKI44_23910 [Acetobacteraceae bacterium]|nr:hypothetical protein [Acetobacteraceae bacterium]